jgi:hypothetical protein
MRLILKVKRKGCELSGRYLCTVDNLFSHLNMPVQIWCPVDCREPKKRAAGRTKITTITVRVNFLFERGVRTAMSFAKSRGRSRSPVSIRPVVIPDGDHYFARIASLKMHSKLLKLGV